MGWQALENGVKVGYPTWCLGACGAHCGDEAKYLTEKHRHRRAGVLVHDICQAYHGFMERSVHTFTNGCRYVALHSIGAVVELWFRGQCGDGLPPVG